jgi:hypothetical protein
MVVILKVLYRDTTMGQENSSLNKKSSAQASLLAQYREAKANLDNATMAETFLGVKEAQELIDWVKEKYSACLFVSNLSEQYPHVEAKVLPSETASDSLQILGQDLVQKVFLKLFIPLEGAANSELEYEAMIYACVIPLLYDFCPFLVKFVGYERCPDLFNQLKTLSTSPMISVSLKNTISKMLSRFESIGSQLIDDPDDLRKRIQQSSINILMTDQIDGGLTLASFFLDYSVDENSNSSFTATDLYIVVFQLVWIAKVFTTFGLRHNDMRLGNFFIRPLKQAMSFRVRHLVEDYYFILPIKYQILVFDYDHGSLTDVVNNPILGTDFCRRGLGCDLPNPGFDSFKLFGELYSTLNKFGLSHRLKKTATNIMEDLKRFQIVPFMKSPCKDFIKGQTPCPIAFSGLDSDRTGRFFFPPTVSYVENPPDEFKETASEIASIWKRNPYSDEFYIPSPPFDEFLCQSVLFSSFRSLRDKYITYKMKPVSAQFFEKEMDSQLYEIPDIQTIETIRVEMARLIFKEFPVFPIKRKYLYKVLMGDNDQEMSTSSKRSPETLEKEQGKAERKTTIIYENTTEHWL